MYKKEEPQSPSLEAQSSHWQRTQQHLYLVAVPSVGSEQVQPKDVQKSSFLSQPSDLRQKQAGTFPGSQSVDNSEERDEVFRAFQN